MLIAQLVVTIDSTHAATVRLSAHHRVSSYHAVLRWDTAAATLGRVDRPQKGFFAERTDLPGRIDFAGFNASGFDRGPVLIVHFLARDRLRVRLVAAKGPDIESVTPDTLSLGSTAWVTIRGRHFSSDSNRIQFGPARIDARPSSEHGTVIRFVVPAELPATAEAPPMRLGPSTYPVRISTPAASSNVVPFTLVERAP